jgi:ribosomal protein S18 acetylase RimI-like enzyme
MTNEQTPYNIRREIRPNDIDAVRQIVESTGYFRPDEADVAVELALENLHKGDQSGYYFLFIDIGNRAVAYCCFGPIPCTIGSFDLYWIAVDNNYRRKGLGGVLLYETERMVAAMKGRKLYIETSSKTRYEDTRSFYEANGYQLASRLKDFYATGDDKVTYEKDIL